MKSRNVLCAFLSVAMILSIVGCSKSGDKKRNERDRDRDEEREESVETTEEPEITEPDAGTAYEISGYTLPFMEGRAWCGYTDGNAKYTALIDTSGNALFTIQGDSYDINPGKIIDGVTYININNDSGSAGDVKNGYIILDTNGNKLYSYEDNGSSEEHQRIIGQYKDRFVVEKHFSSFDKASYSYFVIDKNGSVVLNEYVEESQPAIVDGKMVFYKAEYGDTFSIDIITGETNHFDGSGYSFWVNLDFSCEQSLQFNGDRIMKVYYSFHHEDYTVPKFSDGVSIVHGWSSGDYCVYQLTGVDWNTYFVLCDKAGNQLNKPVQAGVFNWIVNGYVSLYDKNSNSYIFIDPKGNILRSYEDYVNLPADLTDPRYNNWIVGGGFLNLSIIEPGQKRSGYISLDGKTVINTVNVPGK